MSLARSAWAPTFTTFAQAANRDTPINSLLAGDVDKLENNSTAMNFGLSSALPWRGASYQVGWDNTRATTNNVFANFTPQTGSNLTLQLHPAAAAQFPHRQHAPAAAGLAQESRDLRRAGARGRGHHHPVGEERLLGSGLCAEQPRGAASVARPGAALAQGEPRPRRDRHHGADRHRAGGGRSGPTRRGGDYRRGRHRPHRRRACARSSTASTRPTSGTRGSCRPTWRPSCRWRSTSTALSMARSRSRTDLQQAQKTIEANDVTIRLLRNQLLPDAERVGGLRRHRHRRQPDRPRRRLPGRRSSARRHGRYPDVLGDLLRNRLPELDLHAAI